MLFAPSRPLRSVKNFNFCHSFPSHPLASLLLLFFCLICSLHIHTLYPYIYTVYKGSDNC
nr:MAG TPA: hypothetical protein [Caudoviricetes sp.]